MLQPGPKIEHIHTGGAGRGNGLLLHGKRHGRLFRIPPGGCASTVLSDDSKRLMQRKVEDSGVAGRGYGLGLILQKVHGRDTFGHGGGYPGHAPAPGLSPRPVVVLSVLSNAVYGQAAAWGEKLFALAALAEQETPSPDNGVVTGSLGRVHGPLSLDNWWGLQDVVELGGKLFLIEPGAAVDPKTAVPLEFVDECTLRSADPHGFAGIGCSL